MYVRSLNHRCLNSDGNELNLGYKLRRWAQKMLAVMLVEQVRVVRRCVKKVYRPMWFHA